MDKPSKPELQHLRGALGHMYRSFRGVVVINPNPDSRGPHTSFRRNARKTVVADLIRKGWLIETPHRFELTPAGREVIAASQQTIRPKKETP